VLAAVLLFCVKSPDFPKRKSFRENFILRREYAVYYGIETLHGIRKQLYITFGYWLLVNSMGQPPAQIGKIMLIAGVIGLFTQPIIGKSIKRYGEKKVTIFDSFALSVLCLAYAFAPTMLPAHWAVGVVATCFVLDKILFDLGMARTTYIARICGERRSDITPCIYTGIAINHVASITYGVVGGLIWAYSGGPQAVFLTGGLAVVGAGILARKMK
jgi:predicted MFS family arabinose efflux permease